ncbi:MAG: NuoM family protein [Aestuariibacter sp.]
MDLVLLLLIPMLTGIAAWIATRWSDVISRWVSVFGLLMTLVLTLSLQSGAEFSVLWFDSFQIHFSLWLDGLSWILVLLTLLLALLAVAVSWREIQEKTGLFHFNLMFALVGIIGVFLAKDLFLFFFFWEVMLLPMTALIAIWGHENKYYAAIKFFIFTQLSSLLMLIAIIALAIIHKDFAGQWSFDYHQLQLLPIAPQMQYWLMLGFFIAFAVKLPSVPLHTWLPDAHTQAPTAGSVLLAGVLLKTGAYGLLRFIFPLFPDAALAFAPIAATLGVISVLYGAIMAYSQSDFKRLVAYSSISHMGFVMLAIFSFNTIALNGAVATMVAHGLSSAALFCVAGMLQHRMHTREIGAMGGIWQVAPKLGVMTLCFFVAAVGIPGMANFVGEFLSLLGSFQRFPILTALAAFGLVGSAIYGLRMFQGAFQGPSDNLRAQPVPDLDKREMGFCLVLVLALVYLGLFPQHLLRLTETSLVLIQRGAGS